jgi:hypothetical protein
VWTVRYLDEAVEEREQLVIQEKVALDRAVDKLSVLGPDLPYPHQSSVRGASGLRELRPRAGRSPWRALYVRRQDEFVIAAIGPEAEVDERGFRRAVQAALTRLAAGRGGAEA